MRTLRPLNRSLALFTLVVAGISITPSAHGSPAASDALPSWFLAGILVDGPGRVWLDDVAFEVVDTSVPVTGGATSVTSRTPENLDFER